MRWLDVITDTMNMGLGRLQELGIYSLALSLLYGPTLTSMHDYWKNQSFDYMDIIALTMRTHSSDYENPMESMRRTGVSSLHVW